MKIIVAIIAGSWLHSRIVAVVFIVHISRNIVYNYLEPNHTQARAKLFFYWVDLLFIRSCYRIICLHVRYYTLVKTVEDGRQMPSLFNPMVSLCHLHWFIPCEYMDGAWCLDFIKEEVWENIYFFFIKHIREILRASKSRYT